ncbi:hypothetical protein WME76_12330 [Sorangium sp. So ce119]|uniref:hypothetical protein n=1 Tax=Sorangium sp. So ce119 TaxID=3133279 RepID=UPI003F630C1E
MSAGAGGTLAEAIEACDYLRRSPWRYGGERGHKEWLHFCIATEGLELLINLSVVDDLREMAPAGSELARLSVLVHEDTWSGSVRLHPGSEVRVRGGAIDVAIGSTRVTFERGAYVLHIQAPEARVTADLRLDPVTFPSLVNNVRGLDGRAINWAVVPRSRATGTVHVGERTYTLRDAPAYHDHNWGSFGWGNNFAWEWGYGLPSGAENPWTVVFARLNSRGNTAALMQLFFVWRDDRLLRTFRDHEITVRREGLLRPVRLLRLPSSMALVAPSIATDVPRRLVVRAASRGDALEAVFDTQDVAQVIIPNDADDGVTVINEVAGTLTVQGTALGARVALQHRAVFEFLSA